MATKRSEQEWRELIDNFERDGYQNPAVFYIANDVHARDASAVDSDQTAHEKYRAL